MNNIGKRLDLYLSSWKSFDWRMSNCCHFCSGWMKACELGDPMERFSQVTTEREAHRIIRYFGGFEPTVSYFLEKPAVGMPQLKIGDLVMKTLESGRGSLGIVTGRRAAYCGVVGVEYLEITPDQTGWRIQK